MKKLITHPAAYVALYVVFMIPTYILPYMGSNSSLLNAAAAASEAINPMFWSHFIALAILIALAWYRGAAIDKRWIVVFPVLALCFDLIPILNSIPLVPTLMHLAAIILGVAVAKQAPSSAIA